jgi:predicted peptidase
MRFTYLTGLLLCAFNAQAGEATAVIDHPPFKRADEPQRADAPGADPARGQAIESPRGKQADLQSAWEQEIYRLDLPALMAERRLEVDGASMRYRIFVPPGLDAAHPVPLVFYFHHAGQRAQDNAGNRDNLRQLRNDYGSSDLGTGVFVHPESQRRHPCVVVAPQILHENRWQWATGIDWTKPRSDMADRPGRSMAAALAVLDRTIAEQPIDRNRIYVTGTSMGGAGSFEAIARRPKFFAGALIICGAHDDSQGSLFINTPMQLFHGTRDAVIRVERTRQMVDAIRAAGGRQVVYTEYLDLQHMNCRDIVYTTPMVIDWLFAQRRPLE